MQRKYFSFALCTILLLMALLPLFSCHSTKPMGRSDGKNKSAAKDSSATKKIDDSPSEFFQ